MKIFVSIEQPINNYRATTDKNKMNNNTNIKSPKLRLQKLYKWHLRWMNHSGAENGMDSLDWMELDPEKLLNGLLDLVHLL